MTPKEKAKELYEKMRWEAYRLPSKSCALVAVDEIILQCWGYREIDLEKSCDYWKEVKQEIEEL